MKIKLRRKSEIKWENFHEFSTFFLIFRKFYAAFISCFWSKIFPFFIRVVKYFFLQFFILRKISIYYYRKFSYICCKTVFGLKPQQWRVKNFQFFPVKLIHNFIFSKRFNFSTIYNTIYSAFSFFLFPFSYFLFSSFFFLLSLPARMKWDGMKAFFPLSYFSFSLFPVSFFNFPFSFFLFPFHSFPFHSSPFSSFHAPPSSPAYPWPLCVIGPLSGVPCQHHRRIPIACHSTSDSPRDPLSQRQLLFRLGKVLT